MMPIRLTFALLLPVLAGGTAAAAAEANSLGRIIEVPLDHAAPEMGRAPLYYELGAPWDAAKPTVLVVADGQQFYVRRGAVEGIQRETFGDAFNVVGIVGRGATPEFIAAAQTADGQPDWERAWRIFRSDQWLSDIDAVRAALLGARGRVLLYAASGGSFLVHQYLARFGDHARRAFTASPVCPFLIAELGLNSDHFWEEIGAHDPSSQSLLREAMARHAADRATLIMTLQRQNFFVPPERLAAARAELIHALASGDSKTYERAQEEYQVRIVRGFLESAEGIPVRVREYELFQPSEARRRLAGEAVHPDLENQLNFAAPLLALHDGGRIPAPALDMAALHRLDTEVFVLAARRDHTVDYRAAIALAAQYPRHVLFIADDDHMLGGMKAAKAALIRAFLLHGLGSADLRAALAAAEPHRWVEN